MTELLPGKEFMVSEMAWPFTCEQGGNFAFPPDMRPSIPFNAEGQRTWVTEVAKRVEAITGGVGVEYWEIGWVNNAGLGQYKSSPTVVPLPSHFGKYHMYHITLYDRPLTYNRANGL